MFKNTRRFTFLIYRFYINRKVLFLHPSGLLKTL